MPSWVLVLVAVKNALSKRLVAITSTAKLMVAEDVVVNVTGGFGYDIDRNEEASEIVNQAAGRR